jgi:hypothetical protein
LRIDFDTLGERAKMIAPVATALGPHSLAGRSGKHLDRLVGMVGPCRSIAPSAQSGTPFSRGKDFRGDVDYLTSTSDRIGLGFAPFSYREFKISVTKSAEIDTIRTIY